MQVDRISVVNFKRVVELEIDVGSITYLVGGNNSGKSSVLQAIHMGVSCAQISAEFQQVVIAESSLRYCPTGDFQTLGNSAPYENRKDGSRGRIEFFGKTADGADASYKVEIYKARNHHNVGVDRSGVYPGFGQFISDHANLFSVYVPGLAGIPHYEEMQSYASVFKKAAGGEANLVFRNIIRLLDERRLLYKLHSLMFDIIGPCKFRVDFDSSKDLFVDVKVSFTAGYAEDTFVPIDLSGTGVIQITQIFAYVILFNPKLILIDEPDSHLHPSRQSLLSAAFARIVEEYSCKVIVSTHSRHLVSSASNGTNIIWLRNGKVEMHDESGLASMLLDIGALDQLDSSGGDILFCTEDAGKKQLEDCIASLGLKEIVKVISYNGINNAASAIVINNICELFVKRPRVVIHRDRDFLVDEEIAKWSEPYVKEGMEIFCPRLPDMESYYVLADHFAEIYGIDKDIAEEYIADISRENLDRFRKKFREKRRDAVKKFWVDGGGPATEALWPNDEGTNINRILGKELLPKLNALGQNRYGFARNLFATPSTDLSREIKDFLDAHNLIRR
ncbi:MAG: ATP-dependent nuclease [Acidovorax sp.]|uniref:ATP-dependent nuclease n=1 Tax=Acidovorax sp. TaxID=1872122 RepID=UPI00391A702F